MAVILIAILLFMFFTLIVNIKMPRGRDQRGFLLYCTILFVLLASCHFAGTVSHVSNDLTNLANMEWSDDDLAFLKQIMNEQVSQFRQGLLESNTLVETAQRRNSRSKRAGIQSIPSFHHLLCMLVCKLIITFFTC